MSWSIGFIGTPENISKALDDYSETKISGQSKEEFDAALPHMKGLVAQNYGQAGMISITASGHAYKSADNSYGNLTCKIEPLYGQLV